LLTLVLIASVGIFAAACGGDKSDSDDGSTAAETSLQDIKDAGKLVLGCDDAFPPMGFVDESGELVGFDIELARAVAERLGVELEVRPIDWKTKELELENKNIDVIWNGYTITAERDRQVEFTKPYLRNEQMLVVRVDSGIQSKEDLAGKVVGVQMDSAAEALVTEDTAFNDSLQELRAYDNYQQALIDLKSSDRIDAVGVDIILINYVMVQEPGVYRVLSDSLGEEYFGIGCRKGSISLREAIDEALDAMQKDGTTDEITAKWFGDNIVVRDVPKLTQADLQ
jgi:polar amino acid transport system substrate-binding protein